MRCRAMFFGMILAASAAPWTPAVATSAQTWVASNGSDSGGCAITAPCKTLTYALTQTTTGGTINALTSGNFGGVTINKSVKIQAEGVVARSAGVLVNAAANSEVTLRGFIVDREGNTMQDVVRFLNGKALHIENCVIRRGRFGIRFQHTAGHPELAVSDTTVEQNADTGIVVKQGVSGTTVLANIERVRAINNGAGGIGFETQGSGYRVRAAVSDSVAAGNVAAGIYAMSDMAGAIMHVQVTRTTSSTNGQGLQSNGAQAVIAFGDNGITANTVGLQTTGGGQLVSFGNNALRGNLTEGAPTSTVALQ